MWRRSLWFVGWAVALAAVIAFATIRGGFFAWFLLYAGTGLCLYALLTWGMALRSVRVERSLSATRLASDSTLHVQVIIYRSGIWPLFWVRVLEDLPQRWLFRTHGSELFAQPLWKKSCTVSYNVPGLQRGVYEIGRSTLQSGDLLGLVERGRAFPLRDRVVVHPRVFDIGHWPLHVPSVTAGGNRARGRSAEAAAVRGVRDYSRGDRLSRIHWPASARSGKLLAKEFESYTSMDMDVIVDVYRMSYALAPSPAFELALSLAASVITRAHELGMNFSLQIDGADDRNASLNQSNITRCMDALSAAAPVVRGDFRHVLFRRRDDLRTQKTVIVSPRLDAETVSAVETMRSRATVDWFVPAPEGRLNAVQHALVQRLRACGVHVYVHSAAAQLAAREDTHNGQDRS